MIILFTFLVNKHLIVILYVAFLSIKPLIPIEYNLFGLLNSIEYINIAALIYFLTFKFEKIKISNFQKQAILLISVLSIYLIYINFKNAFFELQSVDYMLALRRFVRLFIKNLPLILLILNIRNPVIREYTQVGLYYGIILLSVSTILALFLVSIGFDANAEMSNRYTSVTRFSGFMVEGDKNSLGALLVISLGYYLSIIEKSTQLLRYIPIFILIFGAIIFAGSRTAIVSFAVIILIFSFRNFNKAYAFSVLIAFAVIAIILIPRIELLGGRFLTIVDEINTSTTTSRIGKWIVYLNIISEEPLILLRGNSQEIYLERAAHNFYVQALYNAGIIAFILFIKLIYNQVLLFINVKQTKFFPFYCFLPFAFITMYVSDFGYIYYYVIYLALNDLLVNKNATSNL